MEPFSARTLRRIDDANLDVYQYRMLMHIWRVGLSWESTRTLAAKCRMSVGQVSKTKRWLLEEGWLEQTITPHGKVGVTLAGSEEPKRLEAEKPWSISQHHTALETGRNGDRCVYCGSIEVHSLDHLIPKSRGGSDEDENLMPACDICNKAKGEMTGSEFVKVLIGRGWITDDRSPHERTQQYCSPYEQDVHLVNKAFTTRTGCSSDERHLKDPLLRDPLLSEPNEGEWRGPPTEASDEFPFEGNPVEPAIKSPADERFEAIISVCGMNSNVPRHRKQAEQATASLSDYSAAYILERYGPSGWWYENDWRGQKGEQPTVDALIETIEKAPRRSRFGKNGRHPTKTDRTIERINRMIANDGQ